jgi:chemotaxis signal transduction protein
VAEIGDPTGAVRGEHEDLLRRRAAALAAPSAATGERSLEEVVLLRVGERSFSVPADRVREILPPGPLTGIPQGDHLLVGIRASRGGAVAVSDVTALVAGDGVADPATCLCVVLDGPDPLGILADGATALERDAAAVRLEPDDGALASVAPDGVISLDVDAVLAHPRLRIEAPAPLTPTPRPGGTP